MGVFVGIHGVEESLDPEAWTQGIMLSKYTYDRLLCVERHHLRYFSNQIPGVDGCACAKRVRP